MTRNAPVSALPCGSCKGLLLSATSVDGEDISLSHVKIKRTTEDWRDSVDLGCPLCWWVFRHQSSLLADPPPSPHLTFDYGSSLYIGGMMTVSPAEEVKAPARMDHSAIFYFVAEESNPASMHIGRRPPLETGSDEEFQRARQWIEHCVKTHPECRNDSSSAWFPTRVLDVSHPEDVLLCESPEKNNNYAALSYCWGTRDFVHSSTDTVESHLRKGIPAAIMPPTIQDAIKVTKNLGLRYLWVDSLCIIQDDEEDKAQEVEKMGKVFLNAWVTISAASAESVYDGFLNPTEAWSLEGIPPIVLPWKCLDGEMGAVHLYHQIPTHQDDEQFFIKNPIHSRAWTFQEHKMATRVLGYSKKQLVFACKVVLPAGLRSADDFDADKRFKPYYEEFDEGADWLIFAREYSKRQITFSSDKLPAIAGIASLFGKGDDYRAGLWSSTLLFDMLWIAESPQKCNRPPYWRAPSWSWASIDGPMEHLRDHRWGRGTVNVGFQPVGPTWNRTRTSVESSVTPLRDFAPFGKITDASLSLKGHPVTLHLDLELMKLYRSGHSQNEFIPVGTAEFDTLEDVKSLQVRSMADVTGLVPVTCIALSAYTYDDCITEAVAGLILEKIPTERELYSRIGYFSTLDGIGDYFWTYHIAGTRPFPDYELFYDGARLLDDFDRLKIGRDRAGGKSTSPEAEQPSITSLPVESVQTLGNDELGTLPHQPRTDDLRYESFVCVGTKCQETTNWVAWVNGPRYLCVDCGKNFCQNCRADCKNHEWSKDGDSGETLFHRVVEFRYRIDEGYAAMDGWKIKASEDVHTDTRQVIRIV